MGRRTSIEPALYRPDKIWLSAMFLLAALTGLLFAGAMEARLARDWAWMVVMLALTGAGQVLYWRIARDLVRHWVDRPVDEAVYEPVAWSYDDDDHDHHPGERPNPRPGEQADP